MSDSKVSLDSDNDFPPDFLDDLRILLEKYGLTAQTVGYVSELMGDPVAHLIEIATVESRKCMEYDCDFSED